MSLFQTYAPKDTPFTTEGDAAFIGVNSKDDPASLAPGMTSFAQNNRFLTKTCDARPPLSRPDFIKGNFPPILGWGVFSDPNGVQSILLPTANAVYRCVEGQPISTIGLPSGLILNGRVEFVQTFDKCLLCRAGTPLVWDGMATHFSVITKSDPHDPTTILIPPIRWGVMFQNRLLFKIDRRTFGMSEPLDYTSYDPVNGKIDINTGTSSALEGIVPYPHDSVIAYTNDTILQESSFAVDPTQRVQTILNSILGLAARQTAVMIGNDVLFLAKHKGGGGVYRLSEVIQGVISAGPVPVSDDIQPDLDAIDWTLVNNPDFGAKAVAVGRYYYLLTPDNGTLFVYDTVTSKWQGQDTFGGTRIKEIFTADYQGSRHLFSIGTDNAVYLHTLPGDQDDDYRFGPLAIPHIVESRGFARASNDSNSDRSFRRVDMQVAANHAFADVFIRTPEYNSRRRIGYIFRDRTKYYTFNKADFDPTDPSAVYAAPYREDYYATQAENPPITPQPRQEWRERFAASDRGRYATVRVENRAGRTEIKSISIESIPIKRGRGVFTRTGTNPLQGGANFAAQDFDLLPVGPITTVPDFTATNSGDTSFGDATFNAEDSYGTDDFNDYVLGPIAYLDMAHVGGDTVFGPGTFQPGDNYSVDDFDVYPLGAIATLNGNFDFGDTSFSDGYFVDGQNFGSDDFDNYVPGPIALLNQPVNEGDSGFTEGTFH